jgi:PIN domain nuclease of toxin-antitoxin system
LIYLDTHVVAWLYAGRLDLVPAMARSLIEANVLRISPMVTLELQYLFETGRTTQPGAAVVAALAETIQLEVCDLPFERVVDEALRQVWTRDPFDRLIVGQARCRRAPLVTKDSGILESYADAIWGS